MGLYLWVPICHDNRNLRNEIFDGNGQEGGGSMKKPQKRDPMKWVIPAWIGVNALDVIYQLFKRSGHYYDGQKKERERQDARFDAYREEDIDPYQDESAREES